MKRIIVILSFTVFLASTLGCGNGLLEGTEDAGQPDLSKGAGAISTSSGAGISKSESYQGHFSVGLSPSASTIESEQFQFTFEALPTPQKEVQK